MTTPTPSAADAAREAFEAYCRERGWPEQSVAWREAYARGAATFHARLAKVERERDEARAAAIPPAAQAVIDAAMAQLYQCELRGRDAKEYRAACRVTDHATDAHRATLRKPSRVEQARALLAEAIRSVPTTTERGMERRVDADKFDRALALLDAEIDSNIEEPR